MTGPTNDMVFLGHYTKDTIVTPSGTRIADGGAFFYGVNVAVRMGLRTAAITRLAKEDFHVVGELKDLGVEVLVLPSKHSTCLRLEYPGGNPDERTISVISQADPFRPDDVANVDSKCFLVGASIRGEVSREVLQELSKKDCTVALDVQGYIRVIRNGLLVHEQWPEMESILSLVDVLKTDAVEAESLTGTAEIREAAKILHGYGPSEIVLTHRDGLLVYAGEQFYEERFCPKQTIGRSGRGDTCVAAYMARRLIASPQRSAVWAAAVTSLKLQSSGPFMSDLSDVEVLISSNY